MTYDYLVDPHAIEQESFRQIRAALELSQYSEVEQQVVMRVVHSIGLVEVAKSIRFSQQACQAGLSTLQQKKPILCDVEMVKQGLTKRMLGVEPLCYLNDPSVSALAIEKSETRTMAALQLWSAHLADSIVIIGNAPTALFRLLEMIRAGAAKPALIIGIPVGFVGAAESKQALWDDYQELGLECITVLGAMGGSAIAASVCNALMRYNQNENY